MLLLPASRCGLNAAALGSWPNVSAIVWLFITTCVWLGFQGGFGNFCEWGRTCLSCWSWHVRLRSAYRLGPSKALWTSWNWNSPYPIWLCSASSSAFLSFCCGRNPCSWGCGFLRVADVVLWESCTSDKLQSKGCYRQWVLTWLRCFCQSMLGLWFSVSIFRFWVCLFWA